MPKLVLSRTLVLTTLLLALGAAPAESETWVSPTGDDTSFCDSPDAACKTIGGALDKTPPGGLVKVLQGDYGAVRIEQAVDIIAESGDVSILPGAGVSCGLSAGFVAMCITAPADAVVRIRGFIIDERNTDAIPIRFNSGGALHLENVTLSETSQHFGLEFVPSGSSELYVSDSIISDSRNGTAAGGILIKPTGSASARVQIERTQVMNNKVGISVEGPSTTGAIVVAIEDSSISGNTTNGLQAYEPAGGGSINVSIEDSRIANNGGRGLSSNGSTASVVSIGNSVISSNGAGVVAVPPAQLVSTGGNAVVANNTNGAFTGTVTRQ